MPRPLIYSIGHSNHPIETFIQRLRTFGIECLVDVRSVPYSRYSPHFSKQSLEAHLADVGIKYVHLGDQLGGRPDDPNCFDGAGNVDYARIAEQPWYRDGLQALLGFARQHQVAIMCSEEDPSFCHRNLLITDSLLRANLADVEHIRGEGSREPAEIKPKQTRLF